MSRAPPINRPPANIQSSARMSVAGNQSPQLERRIAHSILSAAGTRYGGQYFDAVFRRRATHPPEAEMTRTLAAIVALAAVPIAAMTTIAVPAQACISCSYVPEVARGATTSGEGRSYSKSRSYRAAEERRARTSRKRAVRSEPAPRKIESAKAAPTEKPSAVKAAPAETNAPEIEHSSFAAAAPSRVETAAIPAATEPGSLTEHSTIATGGSDDAPHATAAVAADKTDETSAGGSNVGCKKFFPSVGMTLSVDCE